MESELRDLTINFGDFTAIDHLNVTMSNGVYGILGVNAAIRIQFCNLISELSEEQPILLSTHTVPVIKYIVNETWLMKDGLFINPDE